MAIGDNPEKHLDAEQHVRRNPHPDFKKVEASRPDWEEDASHSWHYTKTRSPDWTPGSGANDDVWTKTDTVSIDPYEEGRRAVDNYKLMISGIVPRPVGFVSTINPTTNVPNLAPFSFTQMVNHDPPIFVIGFASSIAEAKDTLSNLLTTKECVINIISETYIEAANYTAIDAPSHVSEWPLSGLHPAPSVNVQPSRVAESPFSIEGTLLNAQEFKNPSGKVTGTMCTIQGVYFHIHAAALNAERNIIDPAVLRPICRLGGISYARLTAGFELPRPDYNKELEGENERIKRRHTGTHATKIPKTNRKSKRNPAPLL
ncbi:hypothetical protein SAICODRAFT_68182 [Saitoella complicata NRRL Y-17804]|uniref:uncharacterized protein n=1 Tax=Saitoella complicata (strain BCRC 22490 / CBS 7301 / JCM 7358 / NBRC 10748 / NRRL Y-17804) TaxID=698492 RepID=UPI0008682A02|nr:uncharacterized protein SAICODRAFT_68182 [Saitoella complicata NRRL Y-17804]ODQ49775.1 hypothetical protein SAICODRAFT_68182 [Saitoella complicata NRRL Y-17804]